MSNTSALIIQPEIFQTPLSSFFPRGSFCYFPPLAATGSVQGLWAAFVFPSRLTFCVWDERALWWKSWKLGRALIPWKWEIKSIVAHTASWSDNLATPNAPQQMAKALTRAISAPSGHLQGSYNQYLCGQIHGNIINIPSRSYFFLSPTSGRETCSSILLHTQRYKGQQGFPPHKPFRFKSSKVQNMLRKGTQQSTYHSTFLGSSKPLRRNISTFCYSNWIYCKNTIKKSNACSSFNRFLSTTIGSVSSLGSSSFLLSTFLELRNSLFSFLYCPKASFSLLLYKKNEQISNIHRP